MPEPNMSPGRWKTAFFARLLSGISFAVLAVVVAAHYSIWLLLPGGAGAAINFWYVLILLRHPPAGQSPLRHTESDTLSSAPSISPGRWSTAVFTRLFFGIAFAVVAGVVAAKYTLWLLLPWGACSAISFWYVIVLLRHRPDRPRG